MIRVYLRGGEVRSVRGRYCQRELKDFEAECRKLLTSVRAALLIESVRFSMITAAAFDVLPPTSSVGVRDYYNSYKCVG